jgi:hypothetical protein
MEAGDPGDAPLTLPIALDVAKLPEFYIASRCPACNAAELGCLYCSHDVMQPAHPLCHTATIFVAEPHMHRICGRCGYHTIERMPVHTLEALAQAVVRRGFPVDAAKSWGDFMKFLRDTRDRVEAYMAAQENVDEDGERPVKQE